MTTSEVPTASGHRQPGKQREGGYQQEAAAGADESADHADSDAQQGGLDQRQGLLAVGGGVLAAAQHRDAGGDHDRRERDEQCRARDEPGQQPAGVGAGHGRCAEERGDAPPHPAGPGVGDRADRTGHPDHQQRRGDGRLGVHAGHVGQQRDGQDRSPAAQQAQRDADEDRQSDGQRDHGG